MFHGPSVAAHRFEGEELELLSKTNVALGGDVPQSAAQPTARCKDGAQCKKESGTHLAEALKDPGVVLKVLKRLLLLVLRTSDSGQQTACVKDWRASENAQARLNLGLQAKKFLSHLQLVEPAARRRAFAALRRLLAEHLRSALLKRSEVVPRCPQLHLQLARLLLRRLVRAD